MSISPHTFFDKPSSGRSSKLKAKMNAPSSSMNAQVASRAATPAATFSSSLGVKLRGSTGRSIDVWLQKHKKTQAAGIAQTGQGPVRDEPAASSSVSQRRGQQQSLEAVVALKSKQVDSPPTSSTKPAPVACRKQSLRQVSMLEKHNRMLVELLSKQHPSGSLTAADVHSLMKVLLDSLCHVSCMHLNSMLIMRTTAPRQYQEEDIRVMLQRPLRHKPRISFPPF